MTDRYVTPSKITAWLECGHYLGLRHQLEDGLRDAPSGGMGAFARLLADKGLEHELECLAEYERQGLRVRRVPDHVRGEQFSAWVARVGNPFADDDWDVLYQMPLVHDGVRGIADFVLRDVADGVVSFEPVDSKLVRKEAKPGHVLQLCFYADALAALTGRRVERMHLWLGSGQVETLRADDFGAYWRRLRRRLATVLDEAADEVTEPVRCEHCAFCEFSAVCEQDWRDEDSLVFVAGMRRVEQLAFEAGGVSTLAALAAAHAPVEGFAQRRQERLITQASLQLEARKNETVKPPFVLVKPGADPVWGHGFALLPKPDAGDVFLDFEGHPFWRADSGLFFLFGLIEGAGSGGWKYRTWWAHDRQQEGQQAAALISYLAERREQFPGMHVYHYNHTERSALERLAADHGVGEVALAHLVETGAFVDLYTVARNAVQAGVESYGLKYLERLTGYERGHDIDQGAGAVLEYEEYLTTGSERALQRIAAYNEDDVRATRALRDWLVTERPDDLAWRAAGLEPDGGLPDLDEQVALLHAFGTETPEHLLGDLLGYWRREWQAHLAPLLGRCMADAEELLDDPETIVGLVPVGLQERFDKNGKAIAPGMRFSLPEQNVSGFKGNDSVVFPTDAAAPGFKTVARLDTGAWELELVWKDDGDEPSFPPTVVVRNDWVNPQPKPKALSELASRVIDPAAHGQPGAVALALLRRDLPRFLPGGGPAAGVFTDDLDDMIRWTIGLDRTCVAVQGPPGTGKTYRGARQIRALLKAGKRVGITAMSHPAVNNLLEAVVDLFRELGELDDLCAVKKGAASVRGQLPGVTYTDNNGKAARSSYNLVAGTTWLFASAQLVASPVDVLVIDEAGQLSLADALAACGSAENLLLLGDPLQLAQVAQASHPGGAGRSALEHLLGEDATMPPERGVFLTETRRMHPDVCTFISENVYEGRLTSHPGCARQTTVLGTGLRRLRAVHTGRSTQSREEADLIVAEIQRLLDTPWTNQHGQIKALGPDDVLVVAPYNDQVNLIRAQLDVDPRTAAVPVGTVDKFQGREAAVVFFSMAASTGSDVSRGAGFLFSQNRFNVAISRARCLAYLVCTDQLLDTKGRDVPEMRLISTLCAFDETSVAQGLPLGGPSLRPEALDG